MKAKYWVPIAIVATTAASAGVLVWLWDWFRTQPGLFTLEGIGIVFQLAGVALVVRDLRRGIAFTRNVDTYDHVLSEIEKIAQDIAPDIHPVRFKKALTEARSRVVQDDLVGNAKIVWVSWLGPIVLTAGILLTGAAALFSFAPLR